MDNQCCRFCSEVVSSNDVVGLSTPQATFDNLAARLSTLLQLPVSATDGLSQFVCRSCKHSLLNLEEKLAVKRSVVRAAYQRAGYVAGIPQIQSPSNRSSLTLKRPKDTSGGSGVSPATARARPPSKRATVSHTLFPQDLETLKLNTKHKQSFIQTTDNQNPSEKEQASRLMTGTCMYLHTTCLH